MARKRKPSTSHDAPEAKPIAATESSLANDLPTTCENCGKPYDPALYYCKACGWIIDWERSDAEDAAFAKQQETLENEAPPPKTFAELAEYIEGRRVYLRTYRYFASTEAAKAESIKELADAWHTIRFAVEHASNLPAMRPTADTPEGIELQFGELADHFRSLATGDSSTTPTGKGTGKRRGRKKADYPTEQAEAKLAAEWGRVRDVGEESRAEFAKRKGYTLKAFKLLLGRVRGRKRAKLRAE